MGVKCQIFYERFYDENPFHKGQPGGWVTPESDFRAWNNAMSGKVTIISVAPCVLEEGGGWFFKKTQKVQNITVMYEEK